ncbi:unnamed protein product, partial [Choristocarpus tenellus]
MHCGTYSPLIIKLYLLNLQSDLFHKAGSRHVQHSFIIFNHHIASITNANGLVKRSTVKTIISFLRETCKILMTCPAWQMKQLEQRDKDIRLIPTAFLWKSYRPGG